MLLMLLIVMRCAGMLYVANHCAYIRTCILVTHHKSYIETTDRRDFGGKPSQWRWGRVLPWKIPEFYSVGRARFKNSIFSRFSVPFDYRAHSLQEIVLPRTSDTDGKPRLWCCAFCQPIESVIRHLADIGPWRVPKVVTWPSRKLKICIQTRVEKFMIPKMLFFSIYNEK